VESHIGDQQVGRRLHRSGDFIRRLGGHKVRRRTHAGHRQVFAASWRRAATAISGFAGLLLAVRTGFFTLSISRPLSFASAAA
jgi:hypothetical protein